MMNILKSLLKCESFSDRIAPDLLAIGRGLHK
jgi:hypothetical protein